jgi:hypothetical protein
MGQVSSSIKTFFEDFERASNTFDQALLASLFSDPFMSADPHGNVQVTKREDFLSVIAKRQAFFHALGFQFVKIVPLAETQLGGSYVMVKAHTQMQFAKSPGQPIEMNNEMIYIMFMKDDSSKIVFQLTHEDLLKIMREHGLLPENS